MAFSEVWFLRVIGDESNHAANTGADMQLYAWRRQKGRRGRHGVAGCLVRPTRRMWRQTCGSMGHCDMRHTESIRKQSMGRYGDADKKQLKLKESRETAVSGMGNCSLETSHV